jgi:hypothetical protein
MKIHPLCEAFPALEGAELSELADDIKRNGQLQPILTLDGQIVDGRNRFNACREARVKPKFKPYRGDPLSLVKSLNIHRRHMDESQRAMVAAELIKFSAGSIDPVSKADAAAQLNTSEPTVKRAMRVVKTGSKALKREVVKGKVPVSVAAKIARLPKAKQMAALKERDQLIPASRSPRGGLAAEARADVQAPKAKTGALAAMDRWWKENSARLSSYPPALPKAVFTEIRKVVENAL